MKGRIIDRAGRMVAQVNVDLKDGRFEGWVETLTSEKDIRELFQTYEDVVDGQVLSLLDAIEQRIDALDAVFATSSETTPISDVQIFPRDMVVSFRPRVP